MCVIRPVVQLVLFDVPHLGFASQSDGDHASLLVDLGYRLEDVSHARFHMLAFHAPLVRVEGGSNFAVIENVVATHSEETPH